MIYCIQLIIACIQSDWFSRYSLFSQRFSVPCISSSNRLVTFSKDVPFPSIRTAYSRSGNRLSFIFCTYILIAWLLCHVFVNSTISHFISLLGFITLSVMLRSTTPFHQYGKRNFFSSLSYHISLVQQTFILAVNLILTNTKYVS